MNQPPPISGARDRFAGRVIALLCCVVLLAVGRATAADQPPELRSRVLILDSYHTYYTWSDNELRGIRDTMRQRYPKFEPLLQYLDCKYFADMKHFPIMRDLMRHKYRDTAIPLVIAMDNPALEFALHYRQEIFPAAPIVFCGINGYTPVMLAGQHNITGVAELLDARNTVATMLHLHPGTREILIIHDYTSTGLATRRETEAQLAGLAGRVRIRYMENLGTADLLTRLRRLEPGTLVLALSYSRDRDGRVFDHTEIARLLSDNSPVPVYGTHEERLGHGIVGGSLLGGYGHGAHAARLALQILDGASPSIIPVESADSARFMFDYRQLMRFNIPLDELPAGSIVINRPGSFYRQYRGLVWSAVTAFTGLTLIIGLLTVILFQKRQAARAIAEKAAELERAYGELREFNSLTYHELQEPLRQVAGFVQLLARRYGDRLDADAHDFIGYAVSGVKRLKRLFADFLAYTTLSQSELAVGPVAGDGLLATARSVLQETESATGAVVTSEPLPEVQGDRSMLTELFVHLLHNALTHRRDEPPRIHLSAATAGSQVHISMRDNGIGIPAEYHETVFKIFKQLNSRPDVAGTGIGLAICRKVVERHGGQIWLESAPDLGTTFHFTLPGGATPWTQPKA
ncbi:hypothetical protein GURASL_09650 [Geotalea uraniireducens]|uniref:histidine kinase n=1 Tax=Geotalea uraniireducens TaxID=351604 RepID=A0ABM8EHY4_9BACT|nr:ATP-binding protein [Geotalea uraniireducens]BDV42042.1 hypothetical protein GURASL_09650 [Geotalea uraniireducens]